MPKIGLMLVPSLVALRKESVDRNRNSIKRCLMSVVVALRKESVDRNWPSGRLNMPISVALRKESVDRNDAVCANNHKRRRRSPQGERG